MISDSIRRTPRPQDMTRLNTQELRDIFQVTGLFKPGELVAAIQQVNGNNRVLLTSAVAAFTCLKWLPGTEADRFSFSVVSRSFANPPFFITGEGTHARPWKLRTFAAADQTDPRQAPVIVSLGDDVEGFFQSSPPSPIDLAVVLKNFQRLGAKNAASACVLAWDAPDPLGLAAQGRFVEHCGYPPAR
mgnify:CR=1 FL=1